MQTFITLRSFVMAVLAGFGLTAMSATQFWDTATSAGLQHGDGVWSTSDAKWNVNAGGTNNLSVWTNDNHAVFPSTQAGSSTITVTDSLNVASVTISGGVYAINVSNGGKLLNGAGLSQIGLTASNNSVSVSGNGSTWEVGTSGIKQGLYVGVNAGATNNSLTIDSGAVVANVGAVAVGTNGASDNLLTISNGGQLSSIGGRIGRASGSNRNKAIVTGGGSLWNMGGGYAGVGYGNQPISNQLEIADGAVVSNVSYVYVGESYTSFSLQPGFNSLVISGGGQLFSGAGAAGQNVIGSRFHSNSVWVVGGPGVTSRWDLGGQSILINALVGATNNFFVIDGLGTAGSAVVTNLGMVRLSGDNNAVGGALSVVNGGFLCLTNAIDFSVGNNATYGESVTITNGGKVLVLPVAGKAYALRMASGSRFLLRDEGSLMDAGGQIFNVGNQQSSNLVATVDNGAVLSNATVQIGTLSSGSTGDNGDTLFVANGGKVFGVPGAPVYVGMNGASNSLASLNGAATVWNLGTANLVVGHTGNGNQLFIADGATVTNAGTLNMGFNGSAAAVLNRENRVVVTNGGKLYTTATSYLGYPNGTSSNSITVVGANSLWNAGGANVFVGLSGWAGAQTGHVVRIDQDGTVENVGILGVYTNSNFVSLNGGTLGAASLLVTNGFPFNVGDGDQQALLKIATGPSSSYKGLTVNSNATLRAAGWLGAGTSGVTIASGAAFSAGASGAGALSVGASLTWNGGSVYAFEITNMNLGPGLGWDVVSVSTQLVLNGSGLVIKMDSLGGTPEGFDAGKDYNLRILNFGTQTGYDPTNFTIDTSAFTPAGTWTVTNSGTALWLVFRGGAEPGAADYTWNAPNTGLWSDGANWAGASAPPAGGGASLAVAFGDTGIPYRASNNLAGNFHLNQLRFSSSSGVTNTLWGNPIALTNAGARLDYLAGNNGSFIVSNAMRIAADTEMGGNALDTTLTMMGTLTSTGALTKRGSWNLTLNNTTTLDGPFLMDSPDGRIMLSQVAQFGGSGNITVSNGLITTPTTTSALTFSNAKHNRRALVKGSGAQWSNNCYFAVASKATNVQVIVDGGYFRAWDLQFFANGANDGLFLVTNGGYAVSGANANSLGNSSTNCRLIITGPNSSMYFNQYLPAAGGTGVSNSVLVTKGALVRGSNNFHLRAAASTSSRMNSVTVSEGAIALSYGVNVLGVSNSFLITGAGTLIAPPSVTASSLGVVTDFGNTMTIADQAVATNISLQAGVSGGSSNTLTVSDSGKLFASASDQLIASGSNTVLYGNNTSGNRVTVTGTGSVWNLSARTLYLCSMSGYATGSLNQLLVEAGGLVTNVNSLVVANGTNAFDNSMTVDGGMLQANALVWSNALANSVTLTGGGQMTLARLTVTNANHTFAFNGGTLNVRNSLVSTGAAFVAGNGNQAATLNLLPGIATNWFVDGLVITNNAVLTGNGLIRGASDVFGRLSPGVTIGTITNNGALTLKPGANTQLELAAYTAPGAGWDYLVVTNGALQLGGTLSVLLTGGFAPTNTQSFLVMTNLDPASVSGSFASGSQAPAYTNLGGKSVGYFQVAVGSQGVVLNSFTALKANPGTILYIR